LPARPAKKNRQEGLAVLGRIWCRLCAPIDSFRQGQEKAVKVKEEVAVGGVHFDVCGFQGARAGL